jgi:hypothetical protein
MNPSFRLRRGAALLGCAAALAGTAAAIAPGAALARAAESCGSKTISIPQKSGKSLHVPVSRIRVEGGATCTEAYAVIRGELVNNGPEGWSYGRGNFKVPHGLIAEIATNGHKKVKWATIGGH